MSSSKILNKQRLSWSEKKANSYEYFKHNIDKIDTHSSSISHGGVSEYKRKKVNYDLYNNIVDVSDFEYVCKPFGAEVGELPAQMVNRDICSTIVKSVEGMEMKRPFPWKPIAVNRDASTRKERKETDMIREYVIAETMRPIREKIEAEQAEKTKGRKLTEKEQEELRATIAQELQARTPDKVRQYMQREHQDPSEVLSEQILNYLMQEQNIKHKFSLGWKHVQLSAQEVYYVGIINGKPVMRDINSIRFEHDNSPDLQFIEDGAWARYELRMAPEEVVKMFPELTTAQIDEIFDNYEYYAQRGYEEHVFDFSKSDSDEYEGNYVRVLHATWKGLRKIGFLTYMDENDTHQMDFVDETYKLDKTRGDIDIEWEWLPETYQGYKIGADIYVGMEPVPGQFKDLNDLYTSKLCYYGAVYDNMNSQPTCMMDRMKVYQYYYNIVMYRIELLLASDKGKKILMNIKAIPNEAGINMKQWQYFFESSPFMWYNPDEEGAGYSDANTIAKTIDMSMASDIGKYIEFANYLRTECMRSVGFNDAMLGHISASAEVGNTKQQISQTSNILEPMFSLHTAVKRNVLQSLIDCAKVAYADNDPGILSYILDDMSYRYFEVDQELLANSTIGIFVTNSAKAEESKELIRQLAHAAMQNDKVELSDVLKVIREDSTQEAEEILRAGEEKKTEQAQKAAQAQQIAQKEALQAQADIKETEHKNRLEEITLKEKLQKERELQKQAMMSMGFNEDKDMDDDGVPDILELYKNGADTEIKQKEIQLEKDKFQHQKSVDKEDLKLRKKEANKPKNK